MKPRVRCYKTAEWRCRRKGVGALRLAERAVWMRDLGLEVEEEEETVSEVSVTPGENK